MTRHFMMAGIAALALSACTDGDLTDDVSAAGDEMEAAASDVADAGADMVDEAMNSAEAGMDEMDEAMESRAVDGRWGITQMACSEDNDMRDGVIVISRYDILAGLDQCSITGVGQTPDGFTRFTAECEGGEGDSYTADYEFRASDSGTLIWNNNGRMEEYVACDG